MPKAIEKEIGHGNSSIVPWSAYFDTIERVPALQWPANISVYNEMITDAQVSAVLRAVTLPIRRNRWYIDPNGARDEVVEFVAKDVNLPILGKDPEPEQRTRGRFSHDEHLRHALLALVYGHMFFEQIYVIRDDGRAHLRKLAPRMPGTISQIAVARDGGLEFIRQYPSGNPYSTPLNNTMLGFPSLDMALEAPVIPVERLVAYTNDRVAGNWYGTSTLRQSYKHWLIKDKLMRVDALKNERNGMGVPIAEAPPNASKGQLAMLDRMAQSYKVGDSSGGALPNGAGITFQGVQGSLPDTLASIRYHDEQIAKNMLEMIIQLGTTQTGSRALGETFADVFSVSLEAIGKQYADITNAHVIEDLVDLNFGENEAVPLLRFEVEGPKKLSVKDLTLLIQTGALTVDVELEDYIRAEHDLPEMSDQAKQEKAQPAIAPVIPINQDAQKVAASSGFTVNGKTTRKPNAQETKAGVDFQAIETAYSEAVNSLVNDWTQNVRAAQIEELAFAVSLTAPDNLVGLASIQATPIGSQQLSTAMAALAEVAVTHALNEMQHQGVLLDRPDLTDLTARLGQRAAAVDVLMAKSLSEAAGRAAIAETGGPLTADEIAQRVTDHLTSLTDAYLREQLGGALMQAQNEARIVVFDTVEPKTIYASELLDGRTCGPCGEIDGHEYRDMESAQRDYPAGGYHLCEGGIKCRGTLIAVHATEAQPSAQ